MDLKKYTDKALKDELARREAAAALAAAVERKERIEQIIKHRAELLKMIPHSRTSCNDQEVRNGLYSADYGPRCVRCGLLELSEIDYHEFDVSLQLTITRLESTKVRK